MTRLEPEGLFDDSIFQRMKRDDCQTASWFQHVNRIGDKLIQIVQLSIDRNP